jgi:HK97 family phage major capsid protein
MMDKEVRGKLIAQYDGFVAKANAILNQYVDVELPDEKAAEVDAYLGQADQVQAKMDLFERANPVGEGDGPQSIKTNWRQASPTEGDAPHDPKAWREVEVDTGIRGKKFTVRYNVPLGVQKEGYAGAWEAYMRKGIRNMTDRDRKTLMEGQDSAGGFFVEEDFQMNVIKKVATATIFRQFARVMTTSKDIVSFPRIKYSTDDKYTSGVRMTWTGETPASSTVHRVTDPVVGKVAIPVHTAMASIPFTNDLLEDSAFDVVGYASELFGEAFGLGEEDAFWNGDGAGQPMGVLHNIDGDALDTVQSIISGHATTLLPDGLIDLTYGLPAQYDLNSRIYWNKSTEKAIRKMTINATDTEYIWPVEERVGAFGDAGPTFMANPISRSEFLPNVGAGTFPILYGQLTGYYVIDRVGLSLQRLMEVYAEQNMMVLLGRKRVGGQVVEPWRLKAQKIAAP